VELTPKTVSGVQRVAVVAAVGVAAAAVGAVFLPAPSAVLAGWDLAAATLVAWVWLRVGSFGPEETRRVATREDDSRVVTSFVLLTASLASLVGSGLAIATARAAPEGQRIVLMTVSLLTAFLSWGVVHTEFALRYAHEYYTAPIGGIDFGDDVHPDYRDFAYLAFTVGMTFQVSDTAVTTRKIRRTVLSHALLAYLFGAVILAATVNVIAGIVG
jgi:uncharacterized membrane protein